MKRHRNEIVKDVKDVGVLNRKTFLNFTKNGKTAFAQYYSEFLSKEKSDMLYAELYALKDIYFSRDLVSTPKGKVKAPRLTAAFGEEGIKYGYAGFERKTIIEWPKNLLECKEVIESKLNCKLNYGFVNIYDIIDEDNKPSQQYIGWHSDNEHNIITTSDGQTIICSISLGDERKFQLREIYKVGKEPPTLITSIVLEHGSLCTMEKHTQFLCKHQVPKKNGAQNPRINITFRNMKKN